MDPDPQDVVAAVVAVVAVVLPTEYGVAPPPWNACKMPHSTVSLEQLI